MARTFGRKITIGAIAASTFTIALLFASLAPLHATSDVSGKFVIKTVTEQDLEFGKVATLGGGKIRITPEGDRILSGRLENIGGAYSAARARLLGRPNQRFMIIAPKVQILRQRHGARLQFQRLTTAPSGVSQFDSNGRAVVKFGGDLTVPANAPEGEYRGRVIFWVVQL